MGLSCDVCLLETVGRGEMVVGGKEEGGIARKGSMGCVGEV